MQELQHAACPSYLGRDRAYRRYWLLDTLPGLFVEHDDDFVGACFDSPTPCSANEGPMDEDRALKMARELMSSKVWGLQIISLDSYVVVDFGALIMIQLKVAHID